MCVFVCVYSCVCVRVYLCICVYIYIHMYVYMSIFYLILPYTHRTQAGSQLWGAVEHTPILHLYSHLIQAESQLWVAVEHTHIRLKEAVRIYAHWCSHMRISYRGG